MIKTCRICNKELKKHKKYSRLQWQNVKTCGVACKAEYRRLYFRHTKESKEKNRISHLGKVTMSGETHYNWKGGITPIRKKLYFSQQYKNWRESVFERDDYTCLICSQRGQELNADHIKPWAFFPNERFLLENGRTLCVPCHRKTPTWGRRTMIIMQDI